MISFTVCVCGTFTSMPDWMMGAVNIKMMSSTSTTSTNGVMLISESELCVRPWEFVNAIKKLSHHGVTEATENSKNGIEQGGHGGWGGLFSWNRHCPNPLELRSDFAKTRILSLSTPCPPCSIGLPRPWRKSSFF